VGTTKLGGTGLLGDFMGGTAGGITVTEYSSHLFSIWWVDSPGSAPIYLQFVGRVLYAEFLMVGGVWRSGGVACLGAAGGRLTTADQFWNRC